MCLPPYLTDKETVSQVELDQGHRIRTQPGPLIPKVSSFHGCRSSQMLFQGSVTLDPPGSLENRF